MVIPRPAVLELEGVLKGNPNTAGVYTIMLRVPAHTKIASHSHRDVEHEWEIRDVDFR